MAKYFIIGETGSDELWLIDVDKRSAEPLTQASNAANADIIQIINKARKNGIATTKGVTIAIATNSRSDIQAQMFSEDPVGSKK
ncbi:hypothetical protein CU102_02600 [Phyllobacterium brassicacearum]|uniref:Uncharacterized protein n=1 Tax=Phyllobacterium brassicacearum TaxID=314235 RepID=A0A2P7BWV8_9HYPH|nr:hypothetical protein [Phyllobacterium brassicacearum]PSH70954.1 hypothetical protein CU102_02600 [Phyllobacterium brassicacearum]TDQ35543.1 hypothetical protein DEV91_10125 [Phyllobacterium brassicacearum]